MVFFGHIFDLSPLLWGYMPPKMEETLQSVVIYHLLGLMLIVNTAKQWQCIEAIDSEVDLAAELVRLF